MANWLAGHPSLNWLDGLAWSGMNTVLSWLPKALSFPDKFQTSFDDLFLKIWQGEGCINMGILGDLNQDEILNIMDIIIMVNIILGLDNDQLSADINEDGIMNILDVITLINVILDR